MVQPWMCAGREHKEMGLMRIVILLCLFTILTTPGFGQTSQGILPDDLVFESVFNGKDLSGWDGDPRLWTVQEGVLRGETTSEKVAKGNTFLIYQGGPLQDFAIRLTFRCNATNNSGIQYRSKHITTPGVSNAWVVRGYQHELRNEVNFPNVSGFIYDEGGKRSRLCLVGERTVWNQQGKKVLESLISPAEYGNLFRLDDWNEVMIVAKGNNIKHYMNERLVLDFSDEEPNLALQEGIVALQLHAGKPMWVEFKNIEIAK